jgi:hypothetical protein
MTTEYRYGAPRFIDEENLGQGTKAQAQRMCALMQAKGWDVRYGHNPNQPAIDSDGRELAFPVEAFEADWNACLDELSKDFAPLNDQLRALRANLRPLTRAAIAVLIEALHEEATIESWSAAAALVSVARWHEEGVLDSDLIDAYTGWPGEPLEVLSARIVLQKWERQKQDGAQRESAVK